MDSLVAVFSKNNPDFNIKVVYGSSGNFFQQIGNGAPFDLFFSADIDYPKQLTEKHLNLSVIHLYGTGQLVLWSKTIDPAIDKMNTLLNPPSKRSPSPTRPTPPTANARKKRSATTIFTTR